MQQNSTSSSSRDARTVKCVAASFIFSLIFLLSLSTTSPPFTPTTTTSSSRDPRLFPTTPYILNTTTSSLSSIAYFVTGSSGDLSPITRLVLSIYHPNNIYLLHIDRFAPHSDRHKLALWVNTLPVFKAARNVHVIGHPDFAYPKGSSPLSSLLRAASILLNLSNHWDWFINLSRRMKPIIVDPGLYLSEKTGMFYATQKRDLPTAYQIFSGSPTSVLNRKFIEFCILGSDNLPRTLLMYLANTQSSLLSYLPTILCNSPEFKETAVNHNLQYASYYSSSTENPRHLNQSDYNDMIQSGSAFAAKFYVNDPILDRIDREILGRSYGKVVPGGWCIGKSNDTCEVWGDASILRPGPRAKRLEKRIVDLLSNGAYQNQQCITQ
ncbi:hypothetical protein KSS87_021212 [Heliosperma pusillum]|nr:hypothetical protein KSS87_021212 [Heliosperma pusillum]